MGNAMASARRKIPAPKTDGRILGLTVGARYKGRRRISWKDGDGNRFSFWIDANPVTADPKSVAYVHMAAAESIEEGGSGWFHPDEYPTTVKRWRDLVRRVWAEAQTKNLISANGFADADAKRAMGAEIYRRAGELYDMLGMIIAAHDHDTRGALEDQAKRARKMRAEIAEVGAQTYKDVKQALDRAIAKGV